MAGDQNPCAACAARPGSSFRRSDVPLRRKGTTFVTMLDAVMPAFDETAGAAASDSPAPSGPTASASGRGADPRPSEFELLGLPKPLINGLAKQGIDSPFPIQSA